MKHIMVVTTSFPDHAFSAGQEAAGSFVHDFVAELAKHLRVTVVAPSHTDQIEQLDSITIHRFSVPSLPLSLLKPSRPWLWPDIMKTLVSGQRTVSSALQQYQVDHIFALWAFPSGYWAKTAVKRTGTPYSIWALGSDIWTLGKIPLVKNVLQSVLRQSHRCFADGYQLASDVTALSGRECTFLPSSRKLACPSEKQLSVNSPYNLAFLGRWHKNKGVDLLLASLNLLTDDDWQRIKEVKIYGGGPLADLVHREGEKLTQQGRPVTIGGYLDRGEATALYLWADYLLIPSRIESIPVVFSDAMQCRCPVVAMPVGDLPYLVEKYLVGRVATSVAPATFTNAIHQSLRLQPAIFEHGLKNAKRDFTISTATHHFMHVVKLNE